MTNQRFVCCDFDQFVSVIFRLILALFCRDDRNTTVNKNTHVIVLLSEAIVVTRSEYNSTRKKLNLGHSFCINLAN